MKKGTKFFVFGGLIGLLTGGLIMLITGCIGGVGMFRTILTRYTFHSHNDFGGYYDFGDFMGFTGKEEFDLSAQGIHSLYVDVDGWELKIANREDGERDMACLEITKGIGIDTEYRIEDGTLVIRAKDWWYHSNGEITLYIPKGMEWETVELYFGAGTAEIEDIRAKELYVSIGAGEAVLENIEVTKALSAAVGMGELKLKGAADCDMDISCGMGQILLEFEGNTYYDDYNYDISCAAGNVEIGYISFAGLGVKKTIQNDAKNNINVECGAGEIKILF